MEEETMNESLKKRIISLVMITALVITLIPANISSVHANSILLYGKCGDNVSWSYNVKGELCIGGSGEMYDYPGGNTPWYSSEYCDDVKKIIISDNVTKLGQSAFYGFTGLTSIEWGTGLKEIGGSAFRGCTSLASIAIPNSVDVIGDYAFEGCTKLNKVTMKANGIKMDDGVFYNTLWFQNLPSVYVYDTYLLIKCDGNGGHVTIPEGITQISHLAIKNCSSVTYPSSLEKLEMGDLSGIKNVIIPATVKILETESNFINKIETLTIEGDFENAPEAMFYTNSYDPALTTVTFKNGVTTIHPKMFRNQSNLKNVLLPSTLNEIQNSAFSLCSSLEYVSIPGSVKKIDQSAFWYSGLKSVDLNEGLEVIGKAAFSYTPLREINIPGSVKTIGEYAIGYSGNTKIDGFVIYGHEGSVAQKYAEENGFEFKIVPHSINKSIVRATPQADGAIKESCVCGYSKSTPIPAFSDISIQYTETSYDGSKKTPDVNYVKDRTGRTLVKNVDYAVSYKNNVNVGTATVKITGVGNYTGTVQKTFKIIKPSASEPVTPAPEQPAPEPNPIKITSVTLSASSFVYNGKARKPAVTVKAGKDVIAKKITADTDAIDITYSAGRKNIGKYTVTVKGVGEYKGTIKKTFTIKPKAPTLKVKAVGNRKISLTIGNSTGATGYEIYVKEPGKKKFSLQSKIVKSGSKYKLYAKSGKGWKYIKKLNNRTVKNANLKKGKTYKYKVKAYKTVKGKTYYSGFSKIKSAKVR